MIPLALALPAQVSHFEFCDIEGRIDTIAPAADAAPADAKSSRPMRYTVTVLEARESRSPVGSYIDWRGYIGKPMDLELALPRRAGQATVGDILRVRRSVVDGMDHNGGMITSVNVVFRKLRRALSLRHARLRTTSLSDRCPHGGAILCVLHSVIAHIVRTISTYRRRGAPPSLVVIVPCGPQKRGFSA